VRHLIALAVVTVTVMTTACQDTGATPPVSAAASADTADQTLIGVRLTLADRGVQRALLEADTAFTFDDNSRTELRTVRSTFFTETGLKNGTLTSREGTYNVRSQNMEARGNVVVISDDGRRLETPQLKFDTGRNEISGDSAFVLTRPGEVLRGIGFIADPALTHIQILKGASGRTTKSVAQPDR
jgi:LPS export ABC transporter protein LptC